MKRLFELNKKYKNCIKINCQRWKNIRRKKAKAKKYWMAVDAFDEELVKQTKDY
jgi:hypothetical protein